MLEDTRPTLSLPCVPRDQGHPVSEEKGQEKGGSLESASQAAGLTDEDAPPA